jgi:UDP-N-acetylmuramoyl-tripeptide--D-alanyl-D-alanine ligase
MIWTLGDIMKATGSTFGDTSAHDLNQGISGIDIDSRRITEGDLFIALEGTQTDGHNYLGAARKQGAAAALVGHAVEDELTQIIVPDVITALWDLGRAARARTDAKITAVTGSVGKTGTRDLITTCLSSMGETHATSGNYNNHIGAPLSLARMPQNSDFGIFELGMDHAGEISALSPLVTPHIAVVTRIAESHIGYFDSLKDIAHAKAEIFDGLKEGGLAILNADDDFMPLLRDLAFDRGAGHVMTVGTRGDADARIENISPHDDGYSVTARIDGQEITFTLGMSATHWIWSAVMGLVAAYYLGGEINEAARRLADQRDLDGRGARYNLTLGNGIRFTLIDDSYNASPASMAAAIANLAAASVSENGRRIAILADMLELGDGTEDYHRALITPLTDGQIDMLICFGPVMTNLVDAAKDKMQTYYCNDAKAACKHAQTVIRDGDIVLVKGSNGMKAHVVASTLKNLGQNEGDPHAA